MFLKLLDKVNLAKYVPPQDAVQWAATKRLPGNTELEEPVQQLAVVGR